MPRTTLVTAPTVDPLTLEELKAHVRVETDAEDTLLATFLLTAVQALERRTGLALLSQTWEAAWDAFPDVTPTNPFAAIVVPRPPLLSITSIKYIDTAGVEQTLAGGAYSVNVRAFPGEVTPVYGTSWPGIRSVPNAVVVRFVAGYGTVREQVPLALRQAIRLMAADLWAHREETGEATHNSGAVTSLLANERAYVV